jgi:hypothetical protein
MTRLSQNERCARLKMSAPTNSSLDDVDKETEPLIITGVDEMLEEIEKEAEQLISEFFDPEDENSRKRVAKRDVDAPKRQKLETPEGENIVLPSWGRPWPKNYGNGGLQIFYF